MISDNKVAPAEHAEDQVTPKAVEPEVEEDKQEDKQDDEEAQKLVDKKEEAEKAKKKAQKKADLKMCCYKLNGVPRYLICCFIMCTFCYMIPGFNTGKEQKCADLNRVEMV